jgi:transcriptional regulator with XRE-family HTH domain
VPSVPKLKSVREQRLLTQRELGAKASVHEVTVARLETGANAQFSTIRKLAEALGVQPEELLGT